LLSPAALNQLITGPGRGEELSGGDVLRLIQIRLTTSELDENLASLSSQWARRRALRPDAPLLKRWF